MCLQICFDEQSVYQRKKKKSEKNQASYLCRSFIFNFAEERERFFYVLTHSFSYMRVKQGQTFIVQVPIKVITGYCIIISYHLSIEPS